MRAFPIMSEGNPNTPRSIPWEMLEGHRLQAERNHGQTLERLAERGGLGPSEAVAILEDKSFYEKWSPQQTQTATAELNAHVERFKTQKERAE